MAAEGKKSAPDKRIPESERFRYIGFDVYPGKPGDLFKGEAERNKFVDAIRARREKGDVTRDECKLYEKRVSGLDRVVLTVACLVILGALFLPWFSAYTVVVDEVPAATAPVQEQGLEAAGDPGLAEVMADTEDLSGAAVSPEEGGEPAPTTPPAQAESASPQAPPAEGRQVVRRDGAQSEEVIVGVQARKKVHREYERTTALGALISIGSVGSLVFSSGFILMLTFVLVLVYVLASIGLPIYTLYGLYGVKGDEDQKALKLKRMLKLNWIPVILFVTVIVIAFVGAEYGFDPAAYFTSLGDSYSIATLFDLLSWGMTVTVSGFILLAVKGIEI
jgi:hypothetical protein